MNKFVKYGELYRRAVFAGLLSVVFCHPLQLPVALAAKAEHTNPPHTDKFQERMRLRNEGVAHFESGVALKKSIKVFQDALAIKSNSAIENYNLGVAYRKQNKIDEAITQFKNSLAIKKFAHPYYSLGLIYRDKGDVAAATEAFTSAAEIAPAEPASHYQLSRLYREAGDESKALQSIVNTLQLDPYHTGAIYQLYLYNQNNDEQDKAKDLFTEFSRLKKAFGKTRKELNADESILSQPIDSRNDKVNSVDDSGVFDLKVDVRSILSGQEVSVLEVSDFNRDSIDDLIVGTKTGKLILLAGSSSGEFKQAREYAVPGSPMFKDLAVARFKQKGATEFVISTSKGVYISKTATDGAAPVKKAKGKQVRLSYSDKELDKTFVKLSDTSAKALHLIDVDHDGDLEIVFDGFQSVYINDGKGDFSETDKFVSAQDRKLVSDVDSGVKGSDFRNLVMVDFVLSQDNGRRYLLRDEMGGRYKIMPQDRLAPIEDLIWSDNADMDNDGLSEIVSLTADGLKLDYNRGNHEFELKDVGKSKLNGSFSDLSQSALIADLNNDGLKDVFVASDDDASGVWSQSGGGKYSFSTAIGIEDSAAPVRNLRLIDANSNGLLDIVGLSNNGEIYILDNLTEVMQSHWVKLNLNGLRSSPDAQFVQVEVRYGDFYSKYEASGSNIHIPLGRAPHAEILRITWPNGFVENKFKIDGLNTFAFDESERISGSCPSIYAWDGKKFNYVTDAFISGPMGVPVSEGRYFPVDNDEYVKIPASMIDMDDGKYTISIVEELKEVTYLDKIRIYAIDRPSGTEVFPNEFLNPPDFPEFMLHVTENAREVKSAIDHLGNNVLPLISALDYTYPSQFSRLQYTGFTSPHSVEFELPSSAYGSEELRLFLTGWFYYFDSTSLISASQNSEIKMDLPKLEALVDNRWEPIMTIGIPSGKDKTIVVRPKSPLLQQAQRLRIVSNIEIYWDRILYDTDRLTNKNIEMVELPLSSAKMSFHGFSKLIRTKSDFPQPDRFDYHDVSYQSMWNPLAGNYTKYGKVNALLDNEDSKMAVLGSGDEVKLEFDARALKPLAKGWKRDFVLYLNGFVKDGDKYTAHAGHVDPMPFSGMQAYPFSSSDAATNPARDPEYKNYLNEFQSRSPLTFTRVLID